LTGTTACAINLLDPDRRTFTTAAIRGDQIRATSVSLTELSGDRLQMVCSTWKASQQRAIVVHDPANGWGSIFPPGVENGMLLPLRGLTKVIGFVAVGRRGPPFDADEARVGSSFADQAAVAVARTQMSDALKARQRVIEAFAELTNAVSRTSDVKTLVSALNHDVWSDLDLECTRVTLSGVRLARTLRVGSPSKTELTMMRSWGRLEELVPERHGDEFAFPIHVRGRVQGLLWVKAKGELDWMRQDLIHAAAHGIGEVVAKAKLRTTSERSANELAIAAERERIARDLHDTVGQTLFGIGLKLQDLVFELEDAELSKRVVELRALASRGLADIHSAVYASSSINVRSHGLSASLRVLAREFENASRIPVDLRIQEGLSAPSKEISSALYRVAHEALMNVERHARATAVVLTLTERGGLIHMSIVDDGIGIEQREGLDWRSTGRFGMRLMAKSVEDVGGRLDVTRGHPRGMRIHVTIPRRMEPGGEL
jgi:signal transduction histidine kinase